MSNEIRHTAPEEDPPSDTAVTGGQENPTTASEGRRERSRILFPYGDLEDALDVTNAVFRNGGQRAGFDQLVSWMGHENVDSGTFRFK